jgi:hypothetical protein
LGLACGATGILWTLRRLIAFAAPAGTLEVRGTISTMPCAATQPRGAHDSPRRFRIGSHDFPAPFFTGKSWATWIAAVKAAFAEPQSDDELALFKTVAAGRAPPAERVRELVCTVGRGGGKDSIASFLASYLAVSFNPKGKLRPGERAFVLCLACDKAQAAIAFGYIKGYFERIPALSAMVSNIGPSSIELSNGVTVEIIINSYRSVRGRSIQACIFDEAAFFSWSGACPWIDAYNH